MEIVCPDKDCGYMRAFILIVATAHVVGCAPLSHSVTKVPELRGDLTALGVPVAAAKLLITNSYRDSPCREAVAIGQTGLNGNFRIERKTEQRRTYAPLVAPISVSVYALCITDSDGPVLGYRDIVAPDESRIMNLTCDLKKPYLLRGGDGFEGQAVCRLKNMNSSGEVESDAITRPPFGR
jgi:hypothetical protein